MKKLVALMLVGAMTAAMVTGCGSSADTSASTDAAAEDTAADAEATEDTAEAAEDTAADAKSDLAYVKEKGTLVVGITEFEPMDYKDENGEWIGFDADMAKAFAESLGVTAEFQVIDWDNKILELDGKTIDCVWNGMTLTDEVTSSMECTNAYLNNAQVVVVPADVADQYQDEESLKDLSFAVEADALMEVASKSSDAAVIDSLMAGAMIGEGTGYADLTYTIGLNSEEYGVGFRKGSDLAAALNDYFTTSLEDGSMEKVAETYGVQAALIK